ncbi:hypothetical protein JZ751_001596, partial [Albula glossodonta]
MESKIGESNKNMAKKSPEPGSNSDRDNQKHKPEQESTFPEVLKIVETAEHTEKRGKCPIEAQSKDNRRSLLEAVFHDPNFRVHEGLNMAKFREVMKTIGVTVNDEDLDTMFMKVDANCDGMIYWEEFKMYLLLENEARDSMHKSHRPCYFPEPIKILKESMQRSNSKAVVGLQFYSFKHPQAEEQVAAGGWDDGVCKTRIEPGQYMSDGKRAVFSIGDVSGCVTIFTSCDVVQNGIFNRRTSKTGSNCHITMADLLKNRSNNHFCFKVAVHGNNCQNVRFLAKLHVIASCAACDKSAMVLTSVPESHKSEVHHSVFSLPKGIMCFDYTPELNVLVTGGSDRMVRVWNPYVTKRACSRMEGHLSVITDIVANGRDKKVISISKDKNLRVWDLQDYTCLQKIRPSEIPMGRPPITAIHYTRETNTLVIATSLMAVLQGEMEDLNAHHKESTHKDTVCAALYNPHFKQVVSGCYSGLVCVWDILTGEKVMQFRTSPKRGTDMTAMSFDGPQRRLITGFSDGAVCLWNFNNGVLLLKLPLLDRDEVTGILHVNNKIYMNIRKEIKMEYSVWRRYHTEDIFSMNAYGNKMLVTAAYNGDIIVWNTSTEEPLCWFNAAESPKPMLMD